MQSIRRRLLQGLLGAAATGALPALALTPTPRQTAGPFYPQALPLDHDNDLVRSGDAGLDQQVARGEIAHVTGRVLDANGQPLAGCVVEIWQCDAFGVYHYVGDPRKQDAAFQGFGRTRSAADGGYRFRTIRPVPYGGRTPHIHFRVESPSGRALTTQLYVRGEPRNARDFLFNALDADEREAAQAEFRPFEGADAQLIARFDLVLAV